MTIDTVIGLAIDMVIVMIIRITRHYHKHVYESNQRYDHRDDL